jgi:hypothetical protein
MTTPENDPERTALLLGVGECLSAWSEVEHSLGLLYGALMVGADPNQVADSFGAVRSFATRLKMTGALVEIDKDAAFRDSWNALRKELGNLYEKRHAVAHFSIAWISGENIHRLLPFLKVGQNRNVIPLTSLDLADRVKSFYSAYERIFRLRAYVLHRQGRGSETGIPPGADPTLWLQHPFKGVPASAEDKTLDPSSPG